MRLMVGLGNPGDKYTNTRHNAGFWAIEAVAEALGVGEWYKFKDGLLAEVSFEGEKFLLFKPMQFINTSGIAIRQVTDFYKISLSEVCVLADDVYISPGTARIRDSGGDGGHNGWKSVRAHLGDDSYLRVKIGVGIYEQNPEKRMYQPPLDEYVLQPMKTPEHKEVMSLIDKLVPNLVKWLKHGELEKQTIHLI